MVAAQREQLAQSKAQDCAVLAERAELMPVVSTLLASVQQAAGERHAALDALIGSAASQVDTLVHSSATKLETLGQRLTEQACATGIVLADEDDEPQTRDFDAFRRPQRSLSGRWRTASDLPALTIRACTS